MAFVSRFRVLMEHRKNLHKNAQIELAAARNCFEEIKATREAVRAQIGEQRDSLEERQSRGIHISEYLSFRDYIRALEQQLLSLNNELERAAREVEKARNKLIEKERDLKALESLEERDRIEYRYTQAKKEQRQTDEVAIIKEHNKQTRSREDAGGTEAAQAVAGAIGFAPSHSFNDVP
ncbi:MAG: flagellar export protein FliJ [Syntrophobacteraceae bacterium]